MAFFTRNTRALAASAGILLAVPAAAQSPMDIAVTRFWPAYVAAFVDSSGRVVDNANGSISHSEGQGYGLLLAYFAGDRATFERIWAFTRTELYIRDDGLAAWRWEPGATPHVTDLNNATDGDILIAYALALAADAWNVPAFEDAAEDIARSIASETVIEQRGLTVFLPGVWGFTAADRDDGPVVNLSYWLFEALPVLAALAPRAPWEEITSAGLDLLARSMTGPKRLPPEWTSLGRSQPRPAAGFDMVFGYNAIRIPLYLMRAELATPAMLAPYLANRTADGSSSVVHLTSGTALEPLSDQGYRMVLAAADCAVNGVRVRDDLKAFQADRYYPATLYLLSWFYLAQRHPGCL